MTKPQSAEPGLQIAFAGATGAVGQHLAKRLRASPGCAAVWAWQRGGAEPADGKWHTLPFVDGALKAQVNAFVSALGTTLKRAGSQDAFHAIDVDAVLRRAAEARAQGAQKAVVVSSVGASTSASSFYLRCKAEMEAGILGLGFEQVHVMRPSLLLASRSESRPAEALGQVLAPLLAPALRGRFARYRAVTADTVAERMWECLQGNTPGHFVHHFDGRGWQVSTL
jgi:uncharacterized protein YbjT (DUF2867 family)